MVITVMREEVDARGCEGVALDALQLGLQGLHD